MKLKSKFVPVSVTSNIDEEGLSIESISNASSIRAEGLATIDNNGEVIIDVNDPECNPYFLMHVTLHHGVGYKILTDGDHYILLDGKTRLTISKKLWLRGVKPLTIVDQILIKEAIRLYSEVIYR